MNGRIAISKSGGIRSLLILSAAVLAVIPGVALSQAADSTDLALTEDGYIETMKDYLAVKLDLDSDTRWFVLTLPGNDLDIRPNARIGSRISAHYRFISFSYGYFPGFIPGNNDDALKGDTRARSYSLRLNARHWIQSLSYSRIDGFYLDNTSDYMPEWVEGNDSYITFPDLLYWGIHGFTAYKVNPRFSFKALSSQTERQRKSAGSPMPFLYYHYYEIDNRVELTGQNRSQKSDNLELLLSLGYFHTLILNENFYLSAGLAPGAGIIFTRLLTRLPEGEITTRSNHPIYRLEAQGALGYNARRFFAGAQITASWTEYAQGGSTSIIVGEQIAYQVFAGYRFDAPGFLAGATDRITKIF